MALDHIDEVISIIRSSQTDSEASSRLIERFGFTPEQITDVYKRQYLDDLMTEFDRQKKSNAPIMQAYHGVDVLIIDDIQNIIGKRASVDYFCLLYTSRCV